MGKTYSFNELFFFESDDTDDKVPDDYEHKSGDAKLAPSKEVMKNIMNYSKALCICQTEKNGTLNFVMN